MLLKATTKIEQNNNNINPPFPVIPFFLLRYLLIVK